ncbi:MAG: DUF4924 family protein [Bacteroides sp.]|nr:DUF4924 family protein [Bacteroides sp.]
MRIAAQLRENNIAEYLIYMWQIEDLIRAQGCDPDRIREYLLGRYQFPEEEYKEWERWYLDLALMMREEGVCERGHLQINRNVLIRLTELHRQLLASPRFPYYNAAYFKALPFIVELRSRKENKEEPELETCFEALYGVLLLRLQKKEISKETAQAIKSISDLLSLLANYYDKERKGELEFE